MTYRVKFQCTWVSGWASQINDKGNHSYINKKDFSTLKEAKEYKGRIDEQYKMTKMWEDKKISTKEYKSWVKGFDLIEISNGYISGDSKIVKFFPEREEDI